MESRRMVLMILFAGQHWRCRHREQTVDSGGEGKREAHWEVRIDNTAVVMV